MQDPAAIFINRMQCACIARKQIDLAMCIYIDDSTIGSKKYIFR